MDSGVYDNLSHPLTGERDFQNESAPRAALGSLSANLDSVRQRAILNAHVTPAKLGATLSAYISLAKPRAILPHFITAAAAMSLAAGSMPRISVLLLTLLGGGCAAAAANILNCVLDRDIDARMSRTCGRPLPSGLIKPNHALAFAAVVGLAGIFILGNLVSRLAAMLAVMALLYYVLVYTFWLRRRTYWGAIVGSAIGAFPPIIGWVVVTDRIELTPFLLSAIIILWTIPHFWALALFRRDDYAKAGLQIMPGKGVATWISASSSLLVGASLLLVPAAHLGPVYIVSACLLGAGLLYMSIRVSRGTPVSSSMRLSRIVVVTRNTEVTRQKPIPAARRLFGYSILYIAILFGAMIVDRIVQSAL